MTAIEEWPDVHDGDTVEVTLRGKYTEGEFFRYVGTVNVGGLARWDVPVTAVRVVERARRPLPTEAGAVVAADGRRWMFDGEGRWRPRLAERAGEVSERDVSTWNYRLVKVLNDDGGSMVGLHEVYYLDGEPRARTTLPVRLAWDDEAESRADLDHVSRAWDEPVLDDTEIGGDGGERA